MWINLSTYKIKFLTRFNFLTRVFFAHSVSVREQVILDACVVTGDGDISSCCPSFYDGTDSHYIVEQLSRGSVHVAEAKRETWHTKN